MQHNLVKVQTYFVVNSVLDSLLVLLGARAPGPHPNVHMSSYQYRNSRFKDKTVSRLSYIYNVNPIFGKIVFISGPDDSLVIKCQHRICTGATSERLLELAYLYK